MSLSKMAREKYARVKAHFVHPFIGALWGLEEVVGFLTPIGALLSVGANPDYSLLQKMVYGPAQAAEFAAKAFTSYALNSGVRDVTNSYIAELMHSLGNAGVNIVEKPFESAMSVVGAYVLGRTAAYALRAGRESALKKYTSK